ncbi:Hypothetical predicted protein [Paramuricea clavata]|uniref:MADF domain-containing protein n=1 Tax=Paramuricea clavata TaxID=317549 RepID=A0A7D9IYG3_PARCT|nr:Hypothetical predicted protein [Paramuricea clavata]
MHDKTKQLWSFEETESLINFYHENQSLWNHNIADYHQDSNKDVLYDTLIKILDDKFSAEEIMSKWKELINFFKQEHVKASHKPSGSDTLSKAAKSRKLSKQQEQTEREEKKLELFAQAVNALKAPEPAPAPTQQPTGDNEAAVFANSVRLTLGKFTPRQFRRAKKCISDILYQIEESTDFENMASTSTPSYSENQGYSPASSSAQSMQYQQMALGSSQMPSYTPMSFSNF